MRLPIPLLPWAISVSIEQRSMQPLRWLFRLNTLLIIVGIAALFMGGWVAIQRHQVGKLLEREWKRREIEYRALAASYARSETSHLMDAATGKLSRGFVGDGMGFREIQIGPHEHRRLAEDCGRLKRSYEKAAETPWLPVEPSLGAVECWRIADEQGAMPTRRPPSWARDFGAAAALSKAAMSSGQ
jgi:hypothetical protein